MKQTSNATGKNAAMLIAMLSSFLTPFMVASLNIALPSIGRRFSMGAALMGWVSTSYLLTAAMFLVPFGKVADIVGRKRIFTYGVAIYTLASLLAGLSTSGLFLIGARVMQGIGGAMMTSTIVAILTSVFPASERGKALGASVAATYMGLSLGPLLGGFLTQQLGWRSIFLINVPLGLVVIALALSQLKGEWAEAKDKSLDVAGSIIYGVSLVVLMYGLSLLPKAMGAVLISLGLAGLAGFVRWELRASNPILDMRLIQQNHTFAFSNLAALLNYSATFATTFLLSLYLQTVKSLPPQQAGLILVARSVVMAIFSPLTGRLSDRVEPRVLASAGMGLLSAGLVLLAFLNANTGVGFIVAVLILHGLGYALFSSPNVNAIMGSVEKRHYGVAAAMTGTMRLIGQMLSMGIVTLILALYLGPVEITSEQTEGFLRGARSAFLVSAILCSGGVLASLVRGKIR
jgi:EmrB/QacA subfamily drug resistance transporter